MKKTIVTTLAMVSVVGAGVGVYFEYFETRHVPKVSTAAITTGDIIELVKGTGTLMPLRSVDVGTQVSGIVKHLYVDFNSIVRKGQLLAELDPAVFQTALDSARAMVDQAQIALDEQRQQLAIDQRNLERTQALLADHVAMQQDLDAAALTVKQDEAAMREDQTAIASAEAGVRQAEVNLSHCTIYSPIDGVVISRDVDEGQAVAAQMTTPSLYLLGTDLQTLQLIGDIDEANVGRLRPKQGVTFTVDAYPGTPFHGTVDVVRLNSTTINNVVTYQAVISVPNPNLRLLPGMTANLSIETSRATNTVRVPNNVLRFRPTPGMFAAFAEKVPPGVALTSGVAATTPGISTSVLGWRLKGSSSKALAKGEVVDVPRPPDATIDWFFEPLPATALPGEIWILDNQKLVGLPVEVGITDGTWTQLLSGNIQPGQEAVSSVVTLPAAKNGH
jgi:HlyD family secretion protein